jgi:hypothetical protein
MRPGAWAELDIDVVENTPDHYLLLVDPHNEFACQIDH